MEREAQIDRFERLAYNQKKKGKKIFNDGKIRDHCHRKEGRLGREKGKNNLGSKNDVVLSENTLVTVALLSPKVFH